MQRVSGSAISDDDCDGTVRRGVNHGVTILIETLTDVTMSYEEFYFLSKAKTLLYEACICHGLSCRKLPTMIVMGQSNNVRPTMLHF
jgi:hypothetical protein